MDWDKYHMSMAFLAAMKSKDPSTKIGAVIVGPNNEIRSTGYNGLPRGCNDTLPERDERPTKYFYYEHAERNAIYNAARMGIPLQGCKMYTQGVPCADCCRGVIQSGISEVIVWQAWDASTVREKWLESCKYSTEMFEESGVIVRSYAGPLISEILGQRNEKEFKLHV